MNNITVKPLYESLLPHERQIIQIAALIYEPLSRGLLCMILKDSGLCNESGKRLTENAVAKIITSLEKAGFLIVGFGNNVLLDRDIIDCILIDYCRENPMVPKYREMIYDVLPVVDDKKKELVESIEGEPGLIRDFRNAFFLEDDTAMQMVYATVKAYCNDEDKLITEFYRDMIKYAVTDEHLRLLPDGIRDTIIVEEFYKRLVSFSVIDDFIEALENYVEIVGDVWGSNPINILAECYFFKGNFKALTALAERYDIKNINFIKASVLFVQGDLAGAREAYLQEMRRLTLNKRNKDFCPPMYHGVYFCLIMAAEDEIDNPVFTGAVKKGLKEKMNIRFYHLFNAFIASRKGDGNTVTMFLNKAFSDSTSLPGFDAFLFPVLLIVTHMIDKNIELKDLHSVIAKNAVNAVKNGYNPIAYQSYDVIRTLDKKNKQLTKHKMLFNEKDDVYLHLSRFIEEEAVWKTQLQVLKNIAAAAGGEGKNCRLAWLVNYNEYRMRLEFTPYAQKLLRNGRWSKGKKVPLKRVKELDIEGMSDIDRRIAACIGGPECDIDRYVYGGAYILDYSRALHIFPEHPYLFLADSYTTPVEIAKASLELDITKNDDAYELAFNYSFIQEGLQVIRETASRFVILEVGSLHINIMRALGEDQKLIVPVEAKSALESVTHEFSSLMTVHSDISGSEEANIRTIDADSKPHIHLLPVGEGLRVEFFVRPFHDNGPYIKPAEGRKNIILEIDGEQTRATRDQDQEEYRACMVVHQCPSLAVRGDFQDIFEFETPVECLELLFDLQQIQGVICIEWPEGETFKLRKIFDRDDMEIALGGTIDWFEINGELTLDENRVMSIQELLCVVKQSRFIELGKGEFIALTKEFQNRLLALGDYTYENKGTLKVHPLNALSIDDILHDFTYSKINQYWKKQIKRAKEALNYQPKVPSTFQAQLRNYQEEGFTWLSRLANWGAGACLADDMGLGKTIQALAVIVDRAEAGPSLVVAPTSVCFNWINEAKRFAPTLKPHLFGPGDRRRLIDNAKAYDVIICSYGLLLQEAELLNGVEWNTIVLDEAQAIKNYKAKRTRAAFNLQSNFKMITTGTPVENHLSELWTLFNFINPGLLGPRHEFHELYEIPIEKERDASRRIALKKIITPFILRRKKTHVLDELPPKTEINLSVELSDEEMTFYEGLRRNSLDNIADKEGPAKQLQILAELTRLRRACCHPVLLVKDIVIESSKLAIFGDIVDELIENKHKALVFSQFVDYLTILRSCCDTKGITYQYLDGSTPIKQRQKRVDAFQAGEGDIFLISLKAGGTGLNLTAADYVIHMDPWWNPAVEDQASDRAHRIGQQRPVTVYRFVTKGTVEEKIIALHKNKRELADSLLEGSDITGKISAEELLDLIQ